MQSSLAICVERPDVFCSLCMAAAHVAAQEGEPQGELSEALHRADSSPVTSYEPCSAHRL